MFHPIKANLTDSFKSPATFVVPTVSSMEDRCDQVARVAELPRCSMQDVIPTVRVAPIGVVVLLCAFFFFSLDRTAVEDFPPD